MTIRRAARTGLAWLIGALAFAVLLAAMAGAGSDVYPLTRDVSWVADVDPWEGALSQLGLFAWAGACAVCVFAGLVLRTTGRPRQEVLFFFGLAGLIAFAGLDDAFSFHEIIAPDQLGLDEKIVVAFYANAGLLWAWLVRDQLPRTNWVLLVLAGGSFALSVALDQSPLNGDSLFGLDDFLGVVEEGIKLVGTGTLLVYCFIEGRSAVLSATPGRAPPRRSPAPAPVRRSRAA